MAGLWLELERRDHSGLIGLASLAARRFSLDHGALLSQLADRQQVEFADLERKLSFAIEASGDGMFEADIPRAS